MQIERASGLEDSVELYQSCRHHHQISHHIVTTYGIVKSANQCAYLLRCVHFNVSESVRCCLCPVPGIGEGFYLGFRLNPAIFLEQDVIALFAVKRRVKVDKVNTLIRKVITVPQYFQIVTVVKDIGLHNPPPIIPPGYCGALLQSRSRSQGGQRFSWSVPL
ncbi:hypothetical protein ES703_120228 [subsurface metagenome]